MFKVQLHTHTSLSGCPTAPLKLVLRNAFREGIDVLAITDAKYGRNSNQSLPYRFGPAFREYQVIRADEIFIKLTDGNRILYLLKGLEIHRPDGHLLAIGYDGQVALNPSQLQTFSLEVVIDMIHEKNGLAIAAHTHAIPWSGMGEERLEELCGVLDAMESFNSQLTLWPHYNEAATEFARTHDIPGIATSDSHIGNVAQAYIEIEDIDFTTGRTMVNSIGEAIKTGNFFNVEGYTDLPKLVATAVPIIPLLIRDHVLKKLR